MTEWFHNLLLAFIPIFIAIDPVGLIPIFLGMTPPGMSRARLKKISYQAIWTAAAIALGFVFLGDAIFKLVGITVGDFQIAGGLILFALAARDLLASPEMPHLQRDDIGVVPLGMPLIAGPALITTLLILIHSAGVGPTLVALLVNLALVSLGFRFSQNFVHLIGRSGLRAVSKIIALLLAAIAINMIRRGIEGK